MPKSKKPRRKYNPHRRDRVIDRVLTAQLDNVPKLATVVSNPQPSFAASPMKHTRRFCVGCMSTQPAITRVISGRYHVVCVNCQHVTSAPMHTVAHRG